MRYSRRDVLCQFGAAAGVAALSSRVPHGQAQTPTAPAARISPPSVVSNPPRDFSPAAPPVTYPDPDIMTIDPSFNWSEGPAWSSQGRYLVWSDIPNNRQMRYLEDDGRVTVFRSPSNNSNGNAFDFEGRQISCEHGARRVVRYEHDGSIAVIADSYNGKRLNSPNDVAVHQDGSIWFTDPRLMRSALLLRNDSPPGIRTRTHAASPH